MTQNIHFHFLREEWEKVGSKTDWNPAVQTPNTRAPCLILGASPPFQFCCLQHTSFFSDGSTFCMQCPLEEVSWSWHLQYPGVSTPRQASPSHFNAVVSHGFSSGFLILSSLRGSQERKKNPWPHQSSIFHASKTSNVWLTLFSSAANLRCILGSLDHG